MGFDVSYHPINTEQMDKWYFDRLPEVKKEDYSQIEKIAKEANLDKTWLEQYLQVMKTTLEIDDSEPFEKYHAFLIAIIQGLFDSYFYTRGSALSFLFQEASELKKLATSWSKIKPNDIQCPVSDSLHGNYSGGIYINAEQVSFLLTELTQDSPLKPIFADFFAENFPIFIKALTYAKERNMGLLEASEVIEPNPLNLNNSTCCSNINHCDIEGAIIYHKIAVDQITEALKNHSQQEVTTKTSLWDWLKKWFAKSGS